MQIDRISFVRTTDKPTADLLKDQGFSFLYQRNGIYVFVLDVNSNFDYLLNKDCMITDTLVL